MKKLYPLFIFFFICSPLISQNFFIQLNTGYGFDLAPESFTEGTITYPSPEVRASRVVRHSFGKGYNFGVAAGVRINKNISAGVEANYLKGASEIQSFEVGLLREERIFSSNMLRIIPQVRLEFPIEKWSLFAEIGLAAGIKSEVNYVKKNIYDSAEIGRFKTLYTGGISYGLKSGFGVKYQLTNHLAISSEVRIFAQSYAPARRQLLEAYAEGQDVLGLNIPAKIHTKYVNEYVDDDLGYRDPGVASTQLKFYFPFSSVGANLGFEYSF